jgi:hypothetical protein
VHSGRDGSPGDLVPFEVTVGLEAPGHYGQAARASAAPFFVAADAVTPTGILACWLRLWPGALVADLPEGSGGVGLPNRVAAR